MDVAVKLPVQVVVALVLERRAASRALETFHVQVLVLDAHEHTAIQIRIISLQLTKMDDVV